MIVNYRYLHFFITVKNFSFGERFYFLHRQPTVGKHVSRRWEIKHLYRLKNWCFNTLWLTLCHPQDLKKSRDIYLQEIVDKLSSYLQIYRRLRPSLHAFPLMCITEHNRGPLFYESNESIFNKVTTSTSHWSHRIPIRLAWILAVTSSYKTTPVIACRNSQRKTFQSNWPFWAVETTTKKATV